MTFKFFAPSLCLLLTLTLAARAQYQNPSASAFADKPAVSYSAYKDANGQPGVLIWGQAPFDDFGSRPVQFANPDLRVVNPVPPPGVHPRISFGPDDLPDVRRRLKETKCGQEAWKSILSWTEAMKGNYDDSADYAKPDKTLGGWQGLHARVPLFRLGMPLSSTRSWNHSDKALALWNSLVDGSATDFPPYYWNVFSLEAFRCLIENDQPGAQKVAKAILTALKLDQAKRAADPKLAGKVPDQPIGTFQLAFSYDYLFNWLTPDQKRAMHDELALGTWSHDNYGTFNTAESSRSNWATFSYWLYEVLAIEGEPGFNDLKVRGMYRGWRNLLTYGWFQSGATFEGEAKNQLGMDGILMFTMRQKMYGFDNLCRHPYLIAYADQFLPESINPMLTGFHKYDLLGGSRAGSGGFTPCDFLGLKYMFPNDKRIDWIFRKSMGEDYSGLPDRPDGYYNGLLFAAIYCSDFDPANNDPNKLGLGNTFFCGERALMMTRSSWNTNAMMLNLHVRQENGGHPFADRNSIMVAGAGRIWSPNGYANFKTQENSVVSIDNHTQEVNVPGRLIDFQDNPLATFAVGDASYCWDWKRQVLNKKAGYYTIDDVTNNTVVIPPGWEPEKHTVNDFAYLKLPYSYLNRPAFEYAHWIEPKGALSPIVRQQNYPVKRAFRTAGLVRGAAPYAVVVDDIQKDDTVHHYDWTLSLEYDIQIANITNKNDHEMDILLTGSDPDQTAKRGKEPVPPMAAADTSSGANSNSHAATRKTPMLLVRVLNYNTAPGKAVAPNIVELPNLTSPSKYQTIRRLVIPADSVSPDYKVLFYPFLPGDPMPETIWDTDHKGVTVKLAGQTDHIQFTPGTSGLSHLSITREGNPLVNLTKDVAPLD